MQPVATTSSENLFRLASASTMFRDIVNHPKVWTAVPMAKYQGHQGRYQLHPKVIDIFCRCEQFQNLEAIFRDLFDQYFFFDDEDWFEEIRNAAKAGHMEANYVLALLVFLIGDHKKKEEAEFLCCGNNMKDFDMQICKLCLRARFRQAWSFLPVQVTERYDIVKTNMLLAQVVKNWISMHSSMGGLRMWSLILPSGNPATFVSFFWYRTMRQHTMPHPAYVPFWWSPLSDWIRRWLCYFDELYSTYVKHVWVFHDAFMYQKVWLNLALYVSCEFWVKFSWGCKPSLSLDLIHHFWRSS